MSLASHVRLMASYNEWMNTRLYAAAAQLPEAELAADRKAFFGSILGTLNHLANGDTIWLKRFAGHPAQFAALEEVKAITLPASLGEPRFATLAGLAEERARLDRVINAFAAEVTEADLNHSLRYANLQGVTQQRDFFSLLMHFFNHQTHHRGQVTTLLSQQGVDMGPTDLAVLIPDEVQA